MGIFPNATVFDSIQYQKGSKGQILVAGDVFWWPAGVDQKIDINSPDEFASDQKSLSVSRSHALKIADYIIPGHGQKFAISKTPGD